MITFFYLIVFCLGLSFGSFLNCLIHRLAGGQTIWGRSFCPKCGKKIVWYDNIPIISFILLKSRCRQCGEKISWQYPLVELIMGFLFVVPLLRFSLSGADFLVLGAEGFSLDILEIFRSWIVFFILIFIFVYDLKYSAIEDRVLLPGAGIVFVLNLFASPLIGPLSGLDLSMRFIQMALAVLIGVGFFALQYFLTKGKGIGLGDLRIGLFMGAALAHWSSICLALALSYFIGSLVSLVLIAFEKKKFKSAVPLGPFLAAGTFVIFLFGREILEIIARIL